MIVSNTENINSSYRKLMTSSSEMRPLTSATASITSGDEVCRSLNSNPRSGGHRAIIIEATSEEGLLSSYHIWLLLFMAISAAGLTVAEATQRRQVLGSNALSTTEEEPLWAKFLDKLKEPMVLLLLGSAAVSLLTKQYDDAISIALVSNRAQFILQNLRDGTNTNRVRISVLC